MKFSRVRKNKIIQSLKVGLFGIVVSLILNVIFNKQTIFFETTILGFVIGSSFGLFEYFVSQPFLKKYRFPFVLMIHTTVYTFLILISVSILATIKMSIVHECSIIEAIGDNSIVEFIIDSNLHTLLLLLVVLSFLVNLFFS